MYSAFNIGYSHSSTVDRVFKLHSTFRLAATFYKSTVLRCHALKISPSMIKKVKYSHTLDPQGHISTQNYKQILMQD